MKRTTRNNYVKMEYKQCPVCGELHNHDCGILLDKRLKDIKGNGPNGEVVTGLGLCEKHDRLHKDGFIALIVIANGDTFEDKADLSSADRTGEIIFMQRDAFNSNMSTELGEETEMVFIDKEMYNNIVDAVPPENDTVH